MAGLAESPSRNIVFVSFGFRFFGLRSRLKFWPLGHVPFPVLRRE